jgi:hypothetical protein
MFISTAAPMSGICPLELHDLTNLRYLWMLVCNCYHGLCPTTLIRLEILLGLLDHLEGSFLICFHLLFLKTPTLQAETMTSPDCVAFGELEKLQSFLEMY